MKDLIKQYIIQEIKDGLDYLFNHILAISTFVAAAGVLVQYYYPAHRAEFDAFVTTYLVHQRKPG